MENQSLSTSRHERPLKKEQKMIKWIGTAPDSLSGRVLHYLMQ